MSKNVQFLFKNTVKIAFKTVINYHIINYHCDNGRESMTKSFCVSKKKKKLDFIRNIIL